jgi:hypothetical protein
MSILYAGCMKFPTSRFIRNFVFIFSFSYILFLLQVFYTYISSDFVQSDDHKGSNKIPALSKQNGEAKTESVAEKNPGFDVDYTPVMAHPPIHNR